MWCGTPGICSTLYRQKIKYIERLIRTLNITIYFKIDKILLLNEKILTMGELSPPIRVLPTQTQVGSKLSVDRIFSIVHVGGLNIINIIS